MARYYDLDKLSKLIEAKADTMLDGKGAMLYVAKWLNLLPTADVEEVVRCKDCGRYNKHYGECTLNGSHFGENGYCCKGVRTPQKEG